MKRSVFPGMRFGRLAVVTDAEPQSFPNGRQERRVLCRCDCGNDKIALVSNLRRGYINSCGCLRIEAGKSKNATHGMTGTIEYRAWRHMLNRCYNKKVERYPQYGGRGIIVADEWRGSGGFEAFLAHVGMRPSPRHSIDRIDTDGNYEPGNVRWSLPIDQARTRRTTRIVTIEGEEMSLRQAALSMGLDPMKVYHAVVTKKRDSLEVLGIS